MDEVDDDLAEPRLVAADRRQVVRDVDDEAQALALGEEPEPLGGLARRPAQVDVVEQDERAAALDPGEVEQLVDHLDEVAGLDLDLARSGRASSAGTAVAGGLGVAGQRLGEQADRRERRPQLVRQVVDELGPDLLEAAQLRRRPRGRARRR